MTPKNETNPAAKPESGLTTWMKFLTPGFMSLASLYAVVCMMGVGSLMAAESKYGTPVWQLVGDSMDLALLSRYAVLSVLERLPVASQKVLDLGGQLMLWGLAALAIAALCYWLWRRHVGSWTLKSGTFAKRMQLVHPNRWSFAAKAWGILSSSIVLGIASLVLVWQLLLFGLFVLLMPAMAGYAGASNFMASAEKALPSCSATPSKGEPWLHCVRVENLDGKEPREGVVVMSSRRALLLLDTKTKIASIELLEGRRVLAPWSNAVPAGAPSAASAASSPSAAVKP
jgi:hypothetical protein